MTRRITVRDFNGRCIELNVLRVVDDRRGIIQVELESYPFRYEFFSGSTAQEIREALT